jgi:hypothetical protein
MKLEDCKKCKYHYKSQLDGIICEFSGSFDNRVIAQDKKGRPLVVMCPLEMPLPKKDSSIVASNMSFLVNIS